jgi:hypothetical protein
MEYIEEEEEPMEFSAPSREVIDLCLRFSDEDAAMSVLFTEGRSNYRNIDIIGLIHKPTGVMLLGEDGEYPEVLPVEGFHVNVRVMPDEDLFTLEPFEVTPTNPVRVWA